MRISIEGNRVKIYDDKGNLLEERDARLEDLIKYIIENIELELEVPGIGKAKGKIKRISV